MPNLIYEISGQVIYRQTQEGVKAHNVEVWDADKENQKALEKVRTNEQGRFQVMLDFSFSKKYSEGRAQYVFFKLYLGKRLIHTTKEYVLRNDDCKTELIIEIEKPEQPMRGIDRVSYNQVQNATSFIRESDFQGVFEDLKTRVKTPVGLLADMVGRSFSGQQVKPVAPPAAKVTDVVNQETHVAKRNLEARDVAVNQVLKYSPQLTGKDIADISTFPPRLKPGQKVNLYEVDGRVKYYSVVKETTGTGEVVQPRIQEKELNEIKEEIRKARQESLQKNDQIDRLSAEVESLRKEQSVIKSSVDQKAFDELKSSVKDVELLRKEISDAKVQIEEINRLREEVRKSRELSQQKDEQVRKLSGELEALQKEQVELKKTVDQTNIQQLKADVKELETLKNEINALKSRQEEFRKLHDAVQTSRDELLQKDEQIKKLSSELESVRKEQNELKTMLDPKVVDQLKKDVIEIDRLKKNLGRGNK